jgi:hypothetical protein
VIKVNKIKAQNAFVAFFCLLILSVSAFAANEKNILLLRMIELHVWKPYATYQTKINKMYTPSFKFPLDGVLEVRIKYNEIWKKKQSDPEIEDNITKIYWLNDQVQAISYENRFISNPLTGKKFVPPAYKITQLYDRISIFKTLEKYR